jgi:hypothetical protein
MFKIPGLLACVAVGLLGCVSTPPTSSSHINTLTWTARTGEGNPERLYCACRKS